MSVNFFDFSVLLLISTYFISFNGGIFDSVSKLICKPPQNLYSEQSL